MSAPQFTPDSAFMVLKSKTNKVTDNISNLSEWCIILTTCIYYNVCTRTLYIDLPSMVEVNLHPHT